MTNEALELLPFLEVETNDAISDIGVGDLDIVSAVCRQLVRIYASS